MHDTVLFSLGNTQQKVMTDSSSQPQSAASCSAATTANLLGALGAVLGYIGAEAATTPTFERLLWPQRSFCNFGFWSIPGLASLCPMGGPLHKAALKTLDRIFENGLLRSPHQGHMLGTAFFPDQGWLYTMYNGSDGQKMNTEELRNCLWVRALMRIPMIPAKQRAANHQSSSSLESGGGKPAPVLRARVAVSRLNISRATTADRDNKLPFVSEVSTTPSPRVYLAICASELTAIATAVGIIAFYRSAWALLWIFPLLIRLLSAACSVQRERLVSATSVAAADDPPCNFEIHCPQSDGNFMLITGPPTLVLQFFRHYGHPKRSRFREVMQIGAIIIFLSLFPFGLLCSTLWMSTKLQYIWLSYQLYVVLAMHVSRFSYVDTSASTESKIAEAFTREDRSRRVASSKRDCSILFGHSLSGNETLRVDLVVTYHTRNQEGKDAMRDLLRVPPKGANPTSPASTTSSEKNSDCLPGTTRLPKKNQ